MNKKVCSFPILFALLALLIGTCAVVFPASAQAAPTSTGSITVSGTVASSYDAYQIFSANVVDGDSDAKIATDLAWVSDAVRDAALPVLHSAGMPNSQTTAQEAAEWLNTDSHLTSALSAQLARSLQSSGAESVALNAGTAAELSCGYWLIVAKDDAIAQGEAGHRADHGPGRRQRRYRQAQGGDPQGRQARAGGQHRRLAEGRRRYGRRRPVLAPLGHGPGGAHRLRHLYGAVRRHHERGARPLQGGREHARIRGGGCGRWLRRRLGRQGRARRHRAREGLDRYHGPVCHQGSGGRQDLHRAHRRPHRRAWRGRRLHRGRRVVAVYNAPLNSACNHGIAKGNPNEVYLRYPRSPFADQSGDASFTRTPSDNACAYTWDLALTKRGSDGDKPLAGAVLSIADDCGRTLAADGTWDAEGKATVTTGEDGRVTVSGVDSGKLEVRELKAPKGYTAFEGTRSVTVKAEGLDVDQVAAAKPKLTITAESPLRADSADGSTGSLEASLINTPTGTPPSITTGGFMPSTGDMAMYAAAAAAVAGAALIVVALLIKRGGGSHKE